MSPINGYSRYSVEHNGRYISEEFYDPTTGNQSVFHYAGIISPQGIWEQHTLSTGDEEIVSIAMRSCKIDNPTRGTTYRVYKNRYNAGQNIMRATASPTRCVKEK
ncbi:MAG: hypothetical protein LUE93_11950 [Bacteroides sp.]|nr:hypothetical protein [Bacteroides sp.]